VKILETERLILREITVDDAAFALDLLNQPSFIKYIGDRGVRDLDQSRDFIENRYRKSYRDHGYGLYVVELKEPVSDTETRRRGDAVHGDGETARKGESEEILENPHAPFRIPQSIGFCGFVRRAELPAPDIGFAFLPQFERKGYGFESADAVMKYGREVLNFERVLAITSLDNESSGKLLLKLGFTFNKIIDTPEGERLNLYSFLYPV